MAANSQIIGSTCEMFTQTAPGRTEKQVVGWLSGQVLNYHRGYFSKSHLVSLTFTASVLFTHHKLSKQCLLISQLSDERSSEFIEMLLHLSGSPSDRAISFMSSRELCADIFHPGFRLSGYTQAALTLSWWSLLGLIHNPSLNLLRMLFGMIGIIFKCNYNRLLKINEQQSKLRQ